MRKGRFEIPEEWRCNGFSDFNDAVVEIFGAGFLWVHISGRRQRTPLRVFTGNKYIFFVNSIKSNIRELSTNIWKPSPTIITAIL
jgi:hypothetical protein